MPGPVAVYLDDGRRLRLQHGPIDLIVGADSAADGRERAFEAAAARFRTVLDELVGELPLLRRRFSPGSANLSGPVARRMTDAIRPFAAAHFVTPMIAVAGSVADEILETMRAAAPLTRAYVNNGGDISLYLDDGSAFSVAMADQDGPRLGKLRFGADSGIRGVATSGAKGRSLSLGIADSVTVVGQDAASADTAATLVANAVDLPDHPDVGREAANRLQPDSDLGARPVVTHVPRLAKAECVAALDRGHILATAMIRTGRILGAALFLQGRYAIAGRPFVEAEGISEDAHA